MDCTVFRVPASEALPDAPPLATSNRWQATCRPSSPGTLLCMYVAASHRAPRYSLHNLSRRWTCCSRVLLIVVFSQPEYMPGLFYGQWVVLV